MTRSIVLTNHKGGVGKSTSATNIALGLVHMLRHVKAHNARVLLVDTDSQGHATLVTTGRNDFGSDDSLYSVLMAERPDAPRVLAECLIQSDWDPDLHVLPSSAMLEGAERELTGTPGAPYRLASALAKVAGRYAAIVIDTRPSFSLMTEMGLLAATDAIIPVEPRYLETVGLLSVISKIQDIREGWRHPNLQVSGILVTKMDKRISGHKDLLAELQDHPPARPAVLRCHPAERGRLLLAPQSPEHFPVRDALGGQQGLRPAGGRYRTRHVTAAGTAEGGVVMSNRRAINTSILDEFTAEIAAAGNGGALYDNSVRVENILLELVRPDPLQPRRVMPDRLYQLFHQGRMTPSQVLRELIMSAIIASKHHGRPFANITDMIKNHTSNEADEPVVLSQEEQLVMDLTNLALTIHDDGQVNPLTVVDVSEGATQQFRIETGERRYWASWLLRDYLSGYSSSDNHSLHRGIGRESLAVPSGEREHVALGSVGAGAGAAGGAAAAVRARLRDARRAGDAGLLPSGSRPESARQA